MPLFCVTEVGHLQFPINEVKIMIKTRNMGALTASGIETPLIQTVSTQVKRLDHLVLDILEVPPTPLKEGSSEWKVLV